MLQGRANFFMDDINIFSKVKDKDLNPPLRKTFPTNKATEGAMGGGRWF
jgi:hypothetical protein